MFTDGARREFLLWNPLPTTNIRALRKFNFVMKDGRVIKRPK